MTQTLTVHDLSLPGAILEDESRVSLYPDV